MKKKLENDDDPNTSGEDKKRSEDEKKRTGEITRNGSYEGNKKTRKTATRVSTKKIIWNKLNWTNKWIVLQKIIPKVWLTKLYLMEWYINANKQ